MAITMQINVRRLGEYAHLWADGGTDWAWSDEEDAVLAWLSSRYTLADLRVILERAESCIRDRQQLTHEPKPAEPVGVTTMQAALRGLATLALHWERFAPKWTAEEDAALCWLADRYAVSDLHVILRRPMRNIETLASSARHAREIASLMRRYRACDLSKA